MTDTDIQRQIKCISNLVDSGFFKENTTKLIRRMLDNDGDEDISDQQKLEAIKYRYINNNN